MSMQVRLLFLFALTVLILGWVGLKRQNDILERQLAAEVEP